MKVTSTSLTICISQIIGEVSEINLKICRIKRRITCLSSEYSKHPISNTAALIEMYEEILSDYEEELAIMLNRM